jgi:hypothetical protein
VLTVEHSYYNIKVKRLSISVFSPSITLELNAMNKVVLNRKDPLAPPPPSDAAERAALRSDLAAGDYQALPTAMRDHRGLPLPRPLRYSDEVLAEAGYAMWAVLDGRPKLTLSGFMDFEFSAGFRGAENDIYTFLDADGIAAMAAFQLADTMEHYRGRALTLSVENLERFIAARTRCRAS